MAQPGLLSWCNETRHSMASDPGRQTFSDRIQQDGFLFLDDYLDNILAGAKQDGLIDLVKTPSRTKASSRNPRTASKLRHIVAISFETDTSNKENRQPTGLFSDVSLRDKSPERAQQSLPRPPLSSPLRDQPAVRSLSTNNEQLLLSPPKSHIPSADIPDDNCLAMPTEQKDLSMIAEDDEPMDHFGNSAGQHHAIRNDMDTSMGPMEPFPSIPLDSPQAAPESLNSEQAANNDVQRPFSPISFGSSGDIDAPRSKDTPMDTTTETEPINQSIEPSMPAPPKTPASAPPASAVDTVPSSYESEDLTDILPASSRQSINLFPSLPAPTHLQKTPGAGLTGPGKRTSWLSKVRQTNKTLDIGAKKSFAAAPLAPVVSSGGKRKSNDFLAGDTAVSEANETHKAQKKVESDVAPLQIRQEVVDTVGTSQDLNDDYEDSPSMQGDVLRQLRKTMAAAQTRGALSKSLGGPAAEAALAQAREAKARAERNVGERNETIALHVHVDTPSPPTPAHDETQPTAPAPLAEEPRAQEAVDTSAPRSELASSTAKPFSKVEDSVFQKPLPSKNAHKMSPFNLPPDVPVFSNPQPVFRPPSPKASKTFTTSSKASATSPYSMPASMSLGLGARLPSPNGPRPQLSKQSTLESMASDSIFDSQGPAWIPSAQETDYTNNMGSQQYDETTPAQGLDEDDSWPMSEKMTDEGVQWTFGEGNVVEDSMTWSSAPTESRELENVGDGGETSGLGHTQSQPQFVPKASPSAMNKGVIPGFFDVDMDDAGVDNDYLTENDISIDPSRMTVALVDNSKNQSQVSLSDSTHSNLGFFGQASKLMSSVLGSAKKAKPEVKSLQLAAAAAKKEQEERDKKAAVMKNMETRRQLAIQKKAEEDKARTLAEEKKIKEEAERRKRERDEEHTGKRILLKPIAKKTQDEDNTKKRKLLAEPTKELKKASSKSNLPSSSKPTYKSAPKPVAGSSGDAPDTKSKPGPKSRTQPASKNRAADDDSAQPSQMLHSQMAARAQAHLNAAANVPPSESIELPDINSDYSDSDDEDRPRYQAPGWAQSPELRRALEDQAVIDPDAIFGAIQPLRMEEVFRTGRASRFRARTSSANWAGSDRLTQEEQADYARRMGFR